MSIDAHCHDAIRLGRLVYDPQLNRLFDSSGHDVFLRHQSVCVLKILIDNIGRVVTKEQLMAEVWRNVFVTDSSLTQCIADIRRAIGDKDREILRAVPKQGYILTGLQKRPDRPEKPPIPRDSDVHAEIIGSPLDLKGRSLLFVTCEDSPSRDELASSDVSSLGGRVLTTGRNAVLFDFADAGTAVRFALKLCLSADAEAPTGMRLHRIGVDLQESGRPVQPTRNDPRGTRAAQFASLARPGEIVVSAEFRDAASAQPDCEFEDLGRCTVPGTTQSVHAFRAHPVNARPPLAPTLNDQDLLPTIAVIPFRARGAAIEHDVIGEIVADDIISVLSRSEEVNVISRLSTTAFRSSDVDLARIGRTLRADFVLYGSYSGDAERVVLSLEFAEVASDRLLWSDRIEVPVSVLLNDTETARQIVQQIRMAMVLSEIRRVRASPLSSLKNYTMLIGAIGLMHRLLPADFETARVLLASLTERLRNQPSPLAWMARWHVLRVQQGWSQVPQEDAAAALDKTRRALEIDPDDSVSLTSEGLVLTNLMRDLGEAEDRYNAALEANPNDASGRLLRGTLYAFQGKGERAVSDTERALHLAPLDPHRFFFLSLAASASLAAERYERALELASRSIRINRTHTSTFRVKTVALMRLGREDEARSAAQELLRLQPGLSASAWLKASPSADFDVGKRFAETLRAAGIPD